MVKKILLVEDDGDLLETLTLFLEDEDYRVKPLDSAKKFAKTFENYKPDAVLLDVKLPDGEGDILAKKLANHPRREKIKIILMSAWDDLPRRAAHANVDGYLKKPFTLDSLLTVLA